MKKTILADATTILSDIKVEIVDWAINETELSMDNYLYRNFIILRGFRTITPTAYDFMYKGEKLPYISEKYKDQALLYIRSYRGNMIIHIDQIKHLTKTITIESPYRDKYDVKLELSRDYDKRIIYRLEHKSHNLNYAITRFDIQSVIAREYALCKEFSYSIDPIPNEPIVLRNRNKTKEIEIITKRENQTWEDFIYHHCSCGYFYRGLHDSLGEYKNEAPWHFNLFLSPKNYQDLMNENCSRNIFGGKTLQKYRNINFVQHDHNTGTSYIKNKDVDVTIHFNRNHKE